MAQSTYIALQPIGIQSISATTAASGPVIAAASAASATVNVYPNYAIFFAEAASCRWRDDGVDPTGAIGMVLPFGQYFYYEGRVDRIKFASATGGNVQVNCALYKAY